VTAVELTPILNVSDFDASVAWFEKVGFQPGFRASAEPGAPTNFGAVVWSAIEIFLCVGAQGGRGDNGAWMSIFVDDGDALHERCRRAGLDVIRPPADEPWGVREFHLRHPDGHVFRIGTGTDPDA
jgi:catechol 2,3-dioxygenase-like lactoylglutathione lyase family enzyme